jgi:hypothetical protein
VCHVISGEKLTLHFREKFKSKQEFISIDPLSIEEKLTSLFLSIGCSETGEALWKCVDAVSILTE